MSCGIGRRSKHSYSVRLPQLRTGGGGVVLRRKKGLVLFGRIRCSPPPPLKPPCRLPRVSSGLDVCASASCLFSDVADGQGVLLWWFRGCGRRPQDVVHVLHLRTFSGAFTAPTQPASHQTHVPGWFVGSIPRFCVLTKACVFVPHTRGRAHVLGSYLSLVLSPPGILGSLVVVAFFIL